MTKVNFSKTFYTTLVKYYTQYNITDNIEIASEIILYKHMNIPLLTFELGGGSGTSESHSELRSSLDASPYSA